MWFLSWQRENKSIMDNLRNIWNKLKDAAGVHECAVCGEVLDDIIIKHSQAQTRLDLFYRHLKRIETARLIGTGEIL